jgi:hypothetical protein
MDTPVFLFLPAKVRITRINAKSSVLGVVKVAFLAEMILVTGIPPPERVECGG